MKRHVYIRETIVDGESTFTVEEKPHCAYAAYHGTVDGHKHGKIPATVKLHLVDISSAPLKQETIR